MSEINVNDNDFIVDDETKKSETSRSDDIRFQSDDSDIEKVKKYKKKRECSKRSIIIISIEGFILFVALALIFAKAKSLIAKKGITNENQGNLAGKKKFSIEEQNISNQTQNINDYNNQEAVKNEENKTDENQEKKNETEKINEENNMLKNNETEKKDGEYNAQMNETEKKDE